MSTTHPGANTCIHSFDDDDDVNVKIIVFWIKGIVKKNEWTFWPNSTFNTYPFSEYISRFRLHIQNLIFFMKIMGRLIPHDFTVILLSPYLNRIPRIKNVFIFWNLIYKSKLHEYIFPFDTVISSSYSGWWWWWRWDDGACTFTGTCFLWHQFLPLCNIIVIKSSYLSTMTAVLAKSYP